MDGRKVANRFSVRVCGCFSVADQKGNRIAFNSRKSQALLAILLFSVDGISARARLMSLLWCTRTKKQQQNSLAKEISILKSTLHKNSPGSVSSDRQNVQLDLERFDIVDLSGASASHGRILDGLDVFDSAAFGGWLADVRNCAVEPSTTTALASTSALPISPATSERLKIELLPVKTHISNAPDFADQIASFNLNRFSDQLVRALFPFGTWDVVDSRTAKLSGPPQIARKTHTVQATAYITDRHYEMQIIVADPNGRTIWMNPTFGCDLMAQRVFSFIDTSVADLVDFFLGYNLSVQAGNVWKNTFDVSEAFSGLFSPGTKPIQEIIGIIDRAIDFDPSGFNSALRNCARMLQFGERLDGYDVVTEELVRHDLTKSLELSPNGALTHAIASHAFSLFLQDDNLAVAHAQKSVAMQPKNGLWAAFLSLALLRSGRVDEAAMWTNRAHNVPQEHAGFIGAVACACFTTLGDFNRAMYHGERALQLNPNFNATKKYLFACYAHLGEPQRAERLASEILQVDQAFGKKGLLSGESALNVKPAIIVLSEAARIVGLR